MPRQTHRDTIPLKDIIFDYVRFNNPEFHVFTGSCSNRPCALTIWTNRKSAIVTKGVFTNLTASVGGLTFHFGTGGVHASIEAQRIHASEEWPIRDIDVEALYPSIAIVNDLAPAHLGTAFAAPYKQIPAERKPIRRAPI